MDTLTEAGEMEEKSENELQGDAFERFVRDQLHNTPKSEHKHLVSTLVPLVFVKAKVYGISSINAVERTGSAVVDLVVMLDWVDPSLAEAMKQYESRSEEH